jgi:hypothetical protein
VNGGVWGEGSVVVRVVVVLDFIGEVLEGAGAPSSSGGVGVEAAHWALPSWSTESGAASLTVGWTSVE